METSSNIYATRDIFHVHVYAQNIDFWYFSTIESAPKALRKESSIFESIFRMLWHISAIWWDEKRWKKGKHRKISLNFIWLVDLMQKFWCRKPGPGSSFSPFFVSVEKCLMISTDVDISNSFRFKYSCHCNKKHICCEFELQSDSGKRVRYDEKSREIEHNLELTKENQKRVVEPLFMLSLSDAFLRKRKSANAIWFSFICSRFFIFWFPLDREKLQYPFFMKANEKHSGLCARNVVNGKCLLNGFNHEWQVLACSENGFEKKTED